MHDTLAKVVQLEADKLLLLLGQCSLQKKDYTAALDKFENLAKNENSAREQSDRSSLRSSALGEDSASDSFAGLIMCCDGRRARHFPIIETR